MKIEIVFGFSGGQMKGECETFDEADKFIQYALKRGAVNIEVPMPDGGTAVADLTAKENIEAAPEVEPEVTPEAAPEVSVADAQAAIKAYAAEHGLEKGREILAKFGLKRTSEITEEHAAGIVGACNE